MQGNIVMKEFKEPKNTEEAFAGGWFHTGDLAVIHEDGYVQIADRSKDIIISGGKNISSVEIRDVLSHIQMLLVQPWLDLTKSGERLCLLLS